MVLKDLPISICPQFANIGVLHTNYITYFPSSFFSTFFINKGVMVELMAHLLTIKIDYSFSP
jgi:hypothetical protein